MWQVARIRAATNRAPLGGSNARQAPRAEGASSQSRNLFPHFLLRTSLKLGEWNTGPKTESSIFGILFPRLQLKSADDKPSGPNWLSSADCFFSNSSEGALPLICSFAILAFRTIKF